MRSVPLISMKFSPRMGTSSRKGRCGIQSFASVCGGQIFYGAASEMMRRVPVFNELFENVFMG